MSAGVQPAILVDPAGRLRRSPRPQLCLCSTRRDTLLSAAKLSLRWIAAVRNLHSWRTPPGARRLACTHRDRSLAAPLILGQGVAGGGGLSGPASGAGSAGGWGGGPGSGGGGLGGAGRGGVGLCRAGFRGAGGCGGRGGGG